MATPTLAAFADVLQKAVTEPGIITHAYHADPIVKTGTADTEAHS